MYSTLELFYLFCLIPSDMKVRIDDTALAPEPLRIILRLELPETR